MHIAKRQNFHPREHIKPHLFLLRFVLRFICTNMDNEIEFSGMKKPRARQAKSLCNCQFSFHSSVKSRYGLATARKKGFPSVTFSIIIFVRSIWLEFFACQYQKLNDGRGNLTPRRCTKDGFTYRWKWKRLLNVQEFNNHFLLRQFHCMSSFIEVSSCSLVKNSFLKRGNRKMQWSSKN